MNIEIQETLTTIPGLHRYTGIAEASKLLTKSEIKYFSQIRGWRFASAALLEVLTIAASVWLSEAYWNPLMYAIVVIIIGSRLHGLGILMHDAAHYRAFTNRRLNDLVGEMLAWPLTLTLQGYRNSHISHHRELNTENDLEWMRKLGQKDFTFPKSRREICLTLLQYISGIKAYDELKDAQKIEGSVYVSPRLRAVRALCLVGVVAASVYLSFWKLLLLYWVVPLFTSLLFFAYVRSVADHFCVEYTHAFNQTRTVVGPLWEMHLFAPHGINYHIEHHLYPGVPFYRLGELHRHLMKNETYTRHAHITHGYSGLLRECMVSRAGAQSA